MATLTTYQFTPEELTNFANHVKDNIAFKMYDDGVIDDPSDVGANYVVVVSRPGFLGRIYAKFKGEDLENKGALLISVHKTIPSKGKEYRFLEEKESTDNAEESKTTDEDDSN